MSSKAILGLEKILKRLKNTTKQAASSIALVGLGKFISDLIVKRTRLGYGVSSELGKRSKLKKLTKKTIEQRKRLFEGGDLSTFTQPSRSNLTRSGQLLDSITFKTQNNKLTIFADENRDFERVTNEDIIIYQAQKGRIFLNVSDQEFRQMVRFYRRTFGDLLKKKSVIT